MNYEKKYNEALKRAKKLYEQGTITESLSHVFPELKESEGDRIRGAIIDHLKDNNLTEWAAWLERQGEHANFRNKIQIGDKVTRNEDGVLVNLSQLNRVAKKVEKQGKNDMGISEATKKKLEDNLNEALEKETPESLNKFLDEQKPAHIDYISGIREELFGIEDNAKNIEGLTESHWVAIRAANRLLGEYIAKEQNTWSEEDEMMLECVLDKIGDLGTGEMCKEWLKSLKYRVQPQPKQEYDDIYDDMAYEMARAVLYDQLKASLHPQSTWKPSDEQLRELRCVISGCSYDIEPLVEIEEQLKKLREE